MVTMVRRMAANDMRIDIFSPSDLELLAEALEQHATNLRGLARKMSDAKIRQVAVDGAQKPVKAKKELRLFTHNLTKAIETKIEEG